MTLSGRFATGACLGLLTGFGATAQAQTTDSFANMSGRLAAAEKPVVVVTTASGGMVRGKLLDLSESSLTVTIGRQNRTMSKAEIVEVAEIRRHAGKGAVAGFWLGAGVGFVAGLVDCVDCGDHVIGYALSAAIGCGTLGAGVGALAGAATRTRRVVYRAPARTSDAQVSLSPIVSARGPGVAVTVRF